MRSLPISPEIPTLDNSAASNYVRCPRLYQLENRDKRLVARQNPETFELEPDRSPGMAFGDLLHQGLDIWYKTKDPMKAMQTILDHPYNEPYNDYLNRTKEKALRMMGMYIANYEDDPQWKVIFTESSFEIYDPDTGIRWGGKIDLVVEWNDKLWIVDHKSTSVYNRSYFDMFFPDVQTAGYTWAVSKLHGRPIYGAIINVLEVNNNKKEKTDIFHRKWFAYEDHHIEAFLEQAKGIYSDISRREEENYYPPRWHACVGKYGKCSWYEYCRLRPENRERFLERETVPNTWDFRDSG